MVSKTHRKKNSSRKAVVKHISPLKESFDALEHAVSKIMKETANPKQRVRKFQVAWRHIFGRPVEGVAAEAYLKVKASTRRKRGGKTRKQKGGFAEPLAGAPLDHITSPGVYGVHGSFPPYLSSGLSFYNTINQDQLNKGVGLAAFEPHVPADMGSNQAGGGPLSDALFVATTRPIDPSSPPTVLNDIQTFIQGRTLGASPDPTQNNLKYM